MFFSVIIHFFVQIRREQSRCRLHGALSPVIQNQWPFPIPKAQSIVRIDAKLRLPQVFGMQSHIPR